MSIIAEMGARAKRASRETALLKRGVKDAALMAAASELRSRAEDVIKANEADMEAARAAGMREIMLDRLHLDASRIESMASGIEQVASLDDPVGGVVNAVERPNGLRIAKRRVPIGVIGMIFESRPNVTADAAALCFKAGNASLLRGGKESLRSNMAIGDAIRSGFASAGVVPDAVQVVGDPDRSLANEMMRMNGTIDLLIPRGSASLISSVVQNSTVPVIETGIGNCHIYVDEYADLDMAVKIIINAKTQRMSVCNACESLVVHEAASERAVPMICRELASRGVEIRGDERARALSADVIPAVPEDWDAEYLDAKISLKIVGTFDEAVEHINEHGTGHSDAIVTRSYERAMQFLDRIDSAAVYVNASTRFTDGFEFGFGGEIGISTQKLHARGPMGLDALTTTKYVILGQGQIRS